MNHRIVQTSVAAPSFNVSALKAGNASEPIVAEADNIIPHLSRTHIQKERFVPDQEPIGPSRAAGPCRDVFRDQQGNYWICRECGTTGNPGPGKYSPISQATLASGFWCS